MRRAKALKFGAGKLARFAALNRGGKERLSHAGVQKARKSLPKKAQAKAPAPRKPSKKGVPERKRPKNKVLISGCSGRDRTCDQVINSHLLYR